MRCDDPCRWNNSTRPGVVGGHMRPITILAALVVSLPATPAPAAGTQPAAVRRPAPDFSLRDASGRSVRLSGLRGNVVLLDFWATWCTGCKVEIPWYMEF